MEYPLTMTYSPLNCRKCCLNPCSNGIPSDYSDSVDGVSEGVLILVLMEYPLTKKNVTDAIN